MNTSVTTLTEELLASFAKDGGINHLDGVNLPSKHAIAGIARDLLRLVFPGYFAGTVTHSSEIRIETANLMQSVLHRLGDELYKSLEYQPPQDLRRVDLRTPAHSLTLDLLSTLPRIREILRTDTEAAYQGDPAALSREEVIVAYPFIEAIAIQRIAHEMYQKQIPLIPRIMTEWAHGRTGMDLHPGAEIGSYFFIDHGTGTVIGETSVIGDHVKMYQGVALIGRSLSGGQALKGQKRHPTVHDRVTLYANATVMGGDTVIGARSTVGANVFLTHSVPPDSLVISEEVKVRVMNKLQRKGPTLGFQI